MEKKFVTNIVFIIIINLIIKPFYIFFIDTKIQYIIGDDNYGMYYSLFNLSLITGVFLDIGILNYYTQKISKNIILTNKYFNLFISIKILLFILYLIINIILIILLKYDNTQIKLLSILLITQLISSFTLFYRTNLIINIDFFKDAIISVVDKVIMIIIFLFIFNSSYIKDINIFDFAIIQLISYTIGFLIAYIYSKKYIKKFSFKINKKYSIALIRQVLPYTLLIILMSIYYRIDNIFIERMLSNGQYLSGIYARAYRFFEITNNFSYLFSVFLLPIFAKLLNNNNKLYNIIKISSNILLPLIIFVNVLILFYAHEIMSLFFDKEIQESSEVLQILIISTFFVGISYIYSTLITANEDIKFLNKISFLSIILSISFNLILLPKIGIKGSAITNLITMIISSTFHYIYCYNKYKLDINWKNIFKYLITILIMILINYSIKNNFGTLIYNFIINILSFIILLLILKIIKINYIKSLLLIKNKN